MMAKYVREIITYTCDMCHEEFDPEDDLAFVSEKFIDWKIIEIPMIFHSDQNDGSYRKPHWSSIPTPDLCPNCAQKMFPTYAIGCQGYNEFYLKGDTND